MMHEKNMANEACMNMVVSCSIGREFGVLDIDMENFRKCVVSIKVRL